MKLYYKVVYIRAEPMTDRQFMRKYHTELPEEKDETDGFRVVFADGKIMWIKKDEFKRVFTELNPKKV